MAEQQLVDYIKKAKEAGQSNDQTRSLLYKNGWSQQEVDEAFSVSANLTQPKPAQPEQAQPDTRVQIQRPVSQEPKQPAQKPQQQQYYQPSAAESMPKTRSLSGTLLRFAVVFVALIALGAAGYFAVSQVSFINETLFSIFGNEVKNEEQQTPAVETAAQPSFAQYSFKSTKVTPAIPSYTISLQDLPNLHNFETSAKTNFSDAQKTALLTDNFFIAKNADKFYGDGEGANRNDDWTYLYDKIGGPYNVWERQPENSVFISSDFVLHVYHKLIDEEFSFIEESSFYPSLQSLSKSMLSSSTQSLSQTQDQPQKDSYTRLSAYFLVASAILENASNDYNKFKQQSFIDDSASDTKTAVLALADSLAKSNNVPDSARNIAKQEINLIFDAKQVTPSPLLGNYQKNMPEDYTQFTPRSHYANNVILRDYFRAMMWYGRMNFLLKSPELTRDAANITSLLTPNLKKQWESIYQPTTFFVGKADDLTIYDYSNAQKKTGFDISKLQNELLTYRNPQIMSSVVVGNDVLSTTKEDLQNTTKGFRFMGQRFTPDAFVFSTLTQGDESADKKTGQKLPSMPTALMISTLMGSSESATLLNTWIKDNAPSSDKVIADRMQSLQSYFNKTTEAQWTQNIYWSWLYTIKSLFNNVNVAGYPIFMKSENWSKKTLQAFLGSWTELKHDTLLYAKQSYAELGAGGPEEKPANPVAKGYVEPNVALFDRLIALITMSRDGLKSFGVLPSHLEQRNNQLLEAVQFYREIAVFELQNQVISDDNFEKLRLSAGNLDSILMSPDSQVMLEKNARSAIIADVHTDICSRDKTTGACSGNSKILYEGDGIPNYIFVAVKDANGARLTKGLVYSYYEFAAPLANRLTDQKWQSINYSASSKNLVMPWWNKSLVK